MITLHFPRRLRRRPILKALLESLDQPQITLLTGTRQAGKTSLMWLLIQRLQKDVPAGQLFYFDLELVTHLEEINQLKDFELFPKMLEAQGADLRQKSYIFIDEIQYLKYPSSFLKYLYDHYQDRLKFIVSGSSSLEIKKKFTDRLTGRLAAFTVEPLSFQESLEFSGRGDRQVIPGIRRILTHNRQITWPAAVQQQTLGGDFERFVVYGGYPAVVLQADLLGKQRLLQQLYSLYVRRDIKDLGNIEDIVGYNRLIQLLAQQVGQLVNESELASSSDLSRPTVRRYLFLLENTFVISLIKPYFTNARKELVKMPKVFFRDGGLRNAVAEEFNLSLDNRGSLVEDVIFTQLNKQLSGSESLHYWRTDAGGEVDFVIKTEKGLVPIEVKYRTMKHPRVPSGLARFIERYQPARALVVSKDYRAMRQVNTTKVDFVPAWSV